MPGTARHDRVGTAVGGVVGLARIHEGYWLRPPPGPQPFRLLPFRKLFLRTSLETLRSADENLISGNRLRGDLLLEKFIVREYYKSVAGFTDSHDAFLGDCADPGARM